MAIEELCTCYNFPPKLDSHFIHSLLHRPVFKDRDGTFSSPSTFCLLFIRMPATYRPTTRTCLCNLQRPRNQPSHMLLVFRPESSSRCNAHHSYTIIITSTSIILSAVLRRRRGSSAIPVVNPNHVCVLFVQIGSARLRGDEKSSLHFAFIHRVNK